MVNFTHSLAVLRIRIRTSEQLKDPDADPGGPKHTDPQHCFRFGILNLTPQI
jgi:hypothetical protein